VKTVLSIRASVATVLKSRASAGGTGAHFLLKDDNHLLGVVRNEQKGAI
jgi:hypothetical protein